MFRLVFLCIALLAAVNAGHLRFGVDTVDSLEIGKYTGLWYQMASNLIAITATKQKDTTCSTALYGDNGDSTISVHNHCNRKTPDGEGYTIDGYAYQTNKDKEPGQLNVKFEGPDSPPFPAPYWVLELGPVNEKGQYDWSIVSDNTSAFLFVLARDVATYNAKYKTEMADRLKKLGFTGFRAPVETYHGSDCKYESVQRMSEIKADLIAM